MSKFIPVEPDKWAELIASEARLKGRVIALEAELESEKAAHKALRSLSFTTAVPSEQYEALCERLQDLNAELHTASCANANAHKEINRLKAEVEKLRFAEDFFRDENKYLREQQSLPDGWNSSVAKACDLLAEKDKEIERLKAEVERLTQELVDEKSANANVEGRQQAANRNLGMENARLKAEVESVRQVAQDNKIETEATRIENARLKADVERLREVGDEMASLFGGDFSDNDGVCYDKKWNAAKDGKPSV